MNRLALLLLIVPILSASSVRRNSFSASQIVTGNLSVERLPTGGVWSVTETFVISGASISIPGLVGAGSSTEVWTVISSNHLGLSGENLLLNSQSGSFNLTLPATGTVKILDVGYASTNPIQVDSPDKIMGSSLSLLVDVNNMGIRFVFVNPTVGWIIDF